VTPKSGQSLDDRDRLDALHETGLLDMPSEEGMQRISRLVSRLLRSPVALASFVEHDRQFFVAATGFEVEPFASQRQTPLSHSFCQYVVLRGSPLIVEDARDHVDLHDNLAIEDLGVIAYLGVPLRSPDGHLLGSLCAIDSTPRIWEAADQDALEDLAALVCDELRLRQVTHENERLTEQLRRESRRDPLTRLHNRRSWQERAPVELARAARDGRPVSAVMLDLDGFKAINDQEGHAAGDRILERLGDCWRPLVRPPDLLVRWGGDEFAVLLSDADQAAAESVAQRLIEAAAGVIAISVGVATWSGQGDADALLDEADRALLAVKDRKRS
jgi:diguanylate cyclase (GGDEF)-like protein